MCDLSEVVGWWTLASIMNAIIQLSVSTFVVTIAYGVCCAKRGNRHKQGGLRPLVDESQGSNRRSSSDSEESAEGMRSVRKPRFNWVKVEKTLRMSLREGLTSEDLIEATFSKIETPESQKATLITEVRSPPPSLGDKDTRLSSTALEMVEKEESSSEGVETATSKAYDFPKVTEEKKQVNKSKSKKERKASGKEKKKTSEDEEEENEEEDDKKTGTKKGDKSSIETKESVVELAAKTVPEKTKSIAEKTKSRRAEVTAADVATQDEENLSTKSQQNMESRSN